MAGDGEKGAGVVVDREAHERAVLVKLRRAKVVCMRRAPEPAFFHHFVYFVENPCVGRIKIGFTAANPEVRLESLENAAGMDLRRLGLIRGYREMERKLHGYFAATRWRSEWFEDHGRLRRFIRDHAAPWSGPEDVPDLMETTDAVVAEMYWSKIEAIDRWFQDNP